MTACYKCQEIRSAPANSNDRKLCGLLAQNAVHAAKAGKSDFVIGQWNNAFITANADHSYQAQ